MTLTVNQSDEAGLGGAQGNPDDDLTPVFHFVRHGESLANAGGLTMPDDAIPLTEKGHHQAALLAMQLPQDTRRIYVSPMLRTHQTAAPYCARLRLVPEVLPELAELSVIDHELIAGMTGVERRKVVRPFWEAPDPDQRMGSRADTFREFETRVESFMAGMDSLPTATVVFGHGIWLGLLAWKLQGNRVTDGQSIRAFRQFQTSLPMHNGVIYNFGRAGNRAWRYSVLEAVKSR
jgi:alpha-ribazole phosphatase